MHTDLDVLTRRGYRAFAHALEYLGRGPTAASRLALSYRASLLSGGR